MLRQCQRAGCGILASVGLGNMGKRNLLLSSLLSNYLNKLVSVVFGLEEENELQ
jgi:hypothetical protein